MTAVTTPPKKQAQRGRPGQSSPKLAYLTIIFLAFAIGIPLLIIVVYSFLEKPSQGTGVKWVFTLENYKALFIQEKLDGTTALDTRYKGAVDIVLLFRCHYRCHFSAFSSSSNVDCHA